MARHRPMLTIVRSLAARSPTGMAFVPEAIREYGVGYHGGRIELERLAEEGMIELRPESGLGRLSKEELGLTIPGPQRTHLSWARLLEEHTMGAAARRNRIVDEPANPDWRTRWIILPEPLVERLFEWHGGQSSALYGLASVGMRNLVSLSMIDAGLAELESIRPSKSTKREHAAVVAGLKEVRQYWREHSAQEAGMGLKEYELDMKDYGIAPDEEVEISTRSG